MKTKIKSASMVKVEMAPYQILFITDRFSTRKHLEVNAPSSFVGNVGTVKVSISVGVVIPSQN